MRMMTVGLRTWIGLTVLIMPVVRCVSLQQGPILFHELWHVQMQLGSLVKMYQIFLQIVSAATTTFPFLDTYSSSLVFVYRFVLAI
jgi:hypothetical protein